MSPRAAWRLEEAGLGPVYEYAAGKTDWLAADLPFEGTAQLAGMVTPHGGGTTGGRTPAREAVPPLATQGFAPVPAPHPAGVVPGAPSPAHPEPPPAEGVGGAGI